MPPVLYFHRSCYEPACKIRRDWHYYAFAIGLIFILNGVVGLLGFEAQGWQTYAVGLVTG